jgi:hypothetical protein
MPIAHDLVPKIPIESGKVKFRFLGPEEGTQIQTPQAKLVISPIIVPQAIISVSEEAPQNALPPKNLRLLEFLESRRYRLAVEAVKKTVNDVFE